RAIWIIGTTERGRTTSRATSRTGAVTATSGAARQEVLRRRCWRNWLGHEVFAQKTSRYPALRFAGNLRPALLFAHNFDQIVAPKASNDRGTRRGRFAAIERAAMDIFLRTHWRRFFALRHGLFRRILADDY